MPLTVQVVSGPIGAGKSSLLHNIRGLTEYEPNVYVLDENMDEWQYYLERMYVSPNNETVFMFQMEVTVHMHNTTKRLEQLADGSECKDVVVFVERSPIDILEVFLPLNRDKLTEDNYKCLVTAMTMYAGRDVWKNATYFYVSCPVRICAERIRKRQRNGEENIDEQYMNRVLTLYDEMARKLGARIIHNHGRHNAHLHSVHVLTELLLKTN